MKNLQILANFGGSVPPVMAGGVQEYWVVDPKNKQLSIYTFVDKDIQEHLIFKGPEKACSITFPDLAIDLQRVFRTILAT